MKTKQTLALLACIFLLFGCGEPTFDASTDEAMEASMDRMKQDMSPEQKKEFEEAAQVLFWEEVDLGPMMQTASRGEEFDTSGIMTKFKQAFDGMTADQIIAKANRIREKRRP